MRTPIRLLLAFLLVLAVAGCSSSSDGQVDAGDGGGTTTTVVSTTTASGPGTGAQKFLYERWAVDTVVEQGKPASYPEAVIDTTQVGVVTVPGCNGAGGPFHLDGDRFAADGPWAHTEMACTAEDGKPDLMARDAFFGSFLMANPTIAVDGDTLTLTTPDATVTAHRL